MKRVQQIRAVLLDVDGTLYHQQALRGLMAFELSTAPFALGSIREALGVWRILKGFREGREALRAMENPSVPLVSLQYSLIAERFCVTSREVEMVVREWMYRRPLKYLSICRRRGMKEFFQLAADRGLRTGVFSDYPVREKLQGLGIHVPLTVELCGTDPEINAFKPNPKGFLYACRLWNLDPGEVLYVGDRHDVDGCGAKAAGMPYVIFSSRTSRRLDPSEKTEFCSITNFRGLCDVIHSVI
ncbi:HAD family hydrolase [uncultured Nitrospira sp.]|uniref:HAD family hydrolase n=1 Tax=uncultured Nitrospira sp. TaxID=157176 RepID=UPI00314046FE